VSASDADSDRLTAVFQGYSGRVFAYALRHCEPGVAEEVVADTFLVAWRRLDDMPATPLPWLLVIARNTIANHRRSRIRQRRLSDAVAALERLHALGNGADHEVIGRDAMARALSTLTDLEREALLLVAWDGLRPAEAATVAGCSPRAFEVRLQRARARLTRAVEDVSSPGPALTQPQEARS
jgi:RNA polymerase sigma-70 factor (ECF subfamily)